MSEHAISPVTYAIVLIVLLLLTGLTMYVSFIPVAGLWHIVFGLMIGAAKASLVVLFFMHALYSPKVTWCVILVACVWLIILLVMTLTDYFSRGMLPYAPGH